MSYVAIYSSCRRQAESIDRKVPIVQRIHAVLYCLKSTANTYAQRKYPSHLRRAGCLLGDTLSDVCQSVMHAVSVTARTALTPGSLSR